MHCEFESKIALLTIWDNMPYMAWYKDAQGKFIAVNQPFADVCGKPKEEIIGKTDFDIWPYELAVSYVNDDNEVIRTRQKKTVEEKIDGNTGEVWLETFKSPVFDGEGNGIGIIGMAKDISLRIQFQLALEEQKRFIKSMMDAIPDLIFFKDIHSVYLGCNQAFAQQFIGLSEEEIIGKRDFDFVKDLNLAQLFRQKDIEVFTSGKNQINEERIQLHNGIWVDIETSKTPFYNNEGQVEGLIGIARDITGRKKVEKKLTESEFRLNLATSSTNIGMWDWKIPLGELVLNEKWATIRGYTLEELAPININTWIHSIHPEDLEKAMAVIDTCLSGTIDYYENEIRLKHKDGQYIWVLDRGKIIEWDVEKRPIRMVGAHFDITQRKHGEEELKRKERLLSAVAMSIKELIDNHDYLEAVTKCFELIGTATMVDRIYIFVNYQDHQEKWFTSQLVEWNCDVRASQLDNPDLQHIPFTEIESFISPLIKGEAYCGIVKEFKNDRTRELLEAQHILSIAVLPIIVRGVFWGFVGFDECKYEREWPESEFSTLSAFANSLEKTIERSMIENELKAAKQSAEAANELKSQFVANMSHEIRTPMHAILGYAALMKEVARDEKTIGYLNAIIKAGDNLMTIITDILDLSKIEAGKLELQTGEVIVPHLFDGIRDIFSLGLKEKKIVLSMEIDPKIPEILLLDEVRIRQVLLNLVGNAIKFTEEGSVTVRVKTGDFDGSKVDIIFMVSDTGIGIADDQQESIFEPFKQKDGQNNKKYGGTGLGLSISKRLVDMMGGFIQVESKPKQGSTFTITIPQVRIGRTSKALSREERNRVIQSAEKRDRGSREIKIRSPVIQSLHPEMIEKLELLRQGLWLECNKTNRVSDIRKLVGCIQEIGTSYCHEEILAFANTLQGYADAFDLKNIKVLLEQFPMLIDDFKGNRSTGGE